VYIRSSAVATLLSCKLLAMITSVGRAGGRVA
jgi:hypothetical protein